MTASLFSKNCISRPTSCHEWQAICTCTHSNLSKIHSLSSFAMLFFPLIPSWAKTLQPSPAPSTVCSTRVLIRAWRGLLSRAAHVTHPFTPQRAHTLTHTNMHTREPWRSCVWEQWCVSLIGFINFSQMTLLLHHFLLKRLYFFNSLSLLARCQISLWANTEEVRAEQANLHRLQQEHRFPLRWERVSYSVHDSLSALIQLWHLLLKSWVLLLKSFECGRLLLDSRSLLWSKYICSSISNHSPFIINMLAW